MQYFYINQNSELPTLRMELINDGKFEFIKNNYFNLAIQNTQSITFSMWDESNNLVISNAPCNLILNDESCEDVYIIEYKWKKRDTKKKGQFKGQFKITFNDDLKVSGEEFSIYKRKTEKELEFEISDAKYIEGTLIMPIYEDLTIFIK